jgi:CRP/FNR family transcriptional regulator
MAAQAESLKNYFRSQNLVRVFNKGQVIISQGDEPYSVYLIKSGVVKLYSIDNAGFERTINIFSRDNAFPVTWLLKDLPSQHLYFYEAFTNVVCYQAPIEAARQYISRHTDLLLDLVDSLTKTQINLLGRIQNLEKSHVQERLEFVLYFLATRLGTFNGYVAAINAPITQEDIARLAGVTRESMSIEINKARNKGVMWKEQHVTFIDLQRLDLDDMPQIFAA